MESILPGLDTGSVPQLGDVATASSSSRAAADLNFDTFLRLLTTQLRNQDPLNPLDGTEFTEQIASFSALEQQIATNSNLEQLLQNQSFSQQATAVGFIGRDVLARGNVGTLSGGQLEFTYAQAEQAAVTVIEIFDQTGVRVAALEGNPAAGQHAGIWDGNNAEGEPQPNGEYLIRVSSVDETGTSVEPVTFTFQRVEGVRSDGLGGIFLSLANGEEVSLSGEFTLRDIPDVVPEANDV